MNDDPSNGPNEPENKQLEPAVTVESAMSEGVAPTQEAIIAVLKTIEDPELFLDIWFLGLIYHIGIEERQVKIDMTFTSPMCPAGPMLIDAVRTKVGALPGVASIDVRIVFDPPWQPSDDVKALLGMM